MTGEHRDFRWAVEGKWIMTSKWNEKIPGWTVACRSENVVCTAALWFTLHKSSLQARLFAHYNTLWSTITSITFPKLMSKLKQILYSLVYHRSTHYCSCFGAAVLTTQPESTAYHKLFQYSTCTGMIRKDLFSLVEMVVWETHDTMYIFTCKIYRQYTQ